MSSLLFRFIEDLGIIKKFIDYKDIKSLQEIIDFLLSVGLISDDLYDELMLDLAELSSLSGEDYKRKAKEIEDKINRCIRNVRGVGETYLDDYIRDLFKKEGIKYLPPGAVRGADYVLSHSFIFF